MGLGLRNVSDARQRALLLMGRAAFVALVYGALALWVGHVAGLTPSIADLRGRGDTWMDHHYPAVGVGYIWTILILVGATKLGSVAVSGLQRAQAGKRVNVAAQRIAGFVQISARDARLRAGRRSLLRRLPHDAVCAEIGVWKGDGAAAILRYTRPRKLFLVDPWEHQPQYARACFGGRVGTQTAMDDIHATVVERFRAAINGGSVEVVRARSEDAETIFADGQLDWAWIDADHTYEAVRADLQRFSRLVRPGGYIAGDDYLLGWWGDGVIRAVDEFVSEGRGRLERIGRQHFLIHLASG
jgi:predicted O-methyltransferase YrrM